jgi:hypothetical protein
MAENKKQQSIVWSRRPSWSSYLSRAEEEEKVKSREKEAE